MPTRAPHVHRHETTLSPSLQKDILRLKRLVPYMIVLAAIGFVLWVGFYASGILMGPQEMWTRPGVKPARLGLSPQTVSFRSKDGLALKAWWEKCRVHDPKGTLIIVHGSQMNKAAMGFVAGRMLARGYNVLVPDMRAHGQSAGTYTTYGYKEALDVLAAIRWAREREPNEPVALYGYSSGAVAVLFAAAQSRDVVAVVADSAFASVTGVFEREASYLSHPPKGVEPPLMHRVRLWLLTAPGMRPIAHTMFKLRSGVPLEPPEGQRLLDMLPKLRQARVLYLRSTKDPVVPAEETDRLFRATGALDKHLVIMPGEFHSAIAGNPKRYFEVVTEFLDQMAAPGAPFTQRSAT